MTGSATDSGVVRWDLQIFVLYTSACSKPRQMYTGVPGPRGSCNSESAHYQSFQGGFKKNAYLCPLSFALSWLVLRVCRGAIGCGCCGFHVKALQARSEIGAAGV